MMFDKDLEEQPFEDELPQVDLKNQMSTLYTNARITPSSFAPITSFPSCPGYFQNFFEFETGLDYQLYRHNAILIKKCFLAYLRYCLKEEIEDDNAFENGNIFCFENSLDVHQVDQAYSLIQLITANNLLGESAKKEMLEIFQTYPQLKGLFKEVKLLFGTPITTEILYVLAQLLSAKLKEFQNLQSCQIDEIVPRMERFWGDENDQKIIRGAWSTYSQIQYQEVKAVANSSLETVASTLYLAQKLQYLTLQAVDPPKIAVRNLPDKFQTLLSFITVTLLLTMAGISQKEEDLSEFVKDLHYSIEEGRLREDQPGKKIKSQ